jgi:hypothetical protein
MERRKVMLEGNNRIHHRRDLQHGLLYWLRRQITSTFLPERKKSAPGAAVGIPDLVSLRLEATPDPC